jgi:hypothetical protein
MRLFLLIPSERPWHPVRKAYGGCGSAPLAAEGNEMRSNRWNLSLVLRGLIVALLLAVVGCATTDTGAFIDRNTSFSKYRTYNWAPSGRTDGDARIEKNAFFRDHFEGEVEKQMAAKGFEGPAPRRPDLLVRYRAGVTPRVKVVNAEPTGYGYCSSDCTERVAEFETATLIVDLLDARTRKIVWRGWARNDLNAVLGSEDRMARVITDAVSGMMDRLPGRLAGN